MIFHKGLLLASIFLLQIVNSQESTCDYCGKFFVSFNNTKNYFGIPHPAIRSDGIVFGFDGIGAYFIMDCLFPSCNSTSDPINLVENGNNNGGYAGPDGTWGWNYHLHDPSISTSITRLDRSTCFSVGIDHRPTVLAFKSLKNGKWGAILKPQFSNKLAMWASSCHPSGSMEYLMTDNSDLQLILMDNTEEGEKTFWVVYEALSNKLQLFACLTSKYAECTNGTVPYDVGVNGGLNPNGISVSLINGKPVLFFSFSQVFAVALHCDDLLCNSYKIDNQYGDLSLLGRAVRGVGNTFLAVTITGQNELWTHRCIDDHVPCTKDSRKYLLPSLPSNPSDGSGGVYVWTLDLVTDGEKEFISVAINETFKQPRKDDLQTGNLVYSMTLCASGVISVSPTSIDLIDETRNIRLMGTGFCGEEQCLINGGPVKTQKKSEKELMCTIPLTLYTGNYSVTVKGAFGSGQIQINNHCPNSCYASENHGNCSLEKRQCECRGNFMLPDCKFERIPCDKNCSDAGTCDFSTGICNCTSGRNGTNCAEWNCSLCPYKSCIPKTGECTDPTCDPPCSSRGKCVKGQCLCSDGWSGKDCSNGIDKRSLVATIIVAIYAGILGLLTSFVYFRTIPTLKPPKRTEPLTKRKLSNIITIGSIPLEFIQLSVFGLSLKSEWTRKTYNDASFTLLDISRWTEPIFWTVFVVTLFWSFMIIPLLVKIQGKVLLRRFFQARIFKSVYSLFVLFLIPFGTFLVLPFIKVLLKMVQCNYKSVESHVEGMNSVQCWKSDHWRFVFPALIAFGIYFPLATYSLPRLQTSKKDVEILSNTRFLFCQKMLYAVLVISQVLFVQFETLRIFSAMIISAGLLIASLDSCYNVAWLNKFQTGSYVAAIWTCAMSAWASFISTESRTPLWTLIGGYVAIIIVTLITMSNRFRTMHKGTTEDLLNAFEGNQETPTPTEETSLLRAETLN